ncbi:unnamed protein product, partial [Prorocentrum cordatum]
ASSLHGRVPHRWIRPRRARRARRQHHAAEDGRLFRIDFGFIFGRTPTIDTPQTVIP